MAEIFANGANPGTGFVSAIIGNNQPLCDEIVFPTVRVIEKIHNGEPLGFGDIYTLVLKGILPEGTLSHTLDLSNGREEQLLRIANNRDKDGLAELNAELGLVKGTGGVGKTGADLSAEQAIEVSSLRATSPG